MLIQRPARCLFYVCVKCKPSFQSENCVNSHALVYFDENNLKGTVYQADKFLQVNMTLLTVLIIVLKYIASPFLPYHRLSFETAVAQLIEILSKLSSSIPCIIASDR